MATISPNLVQTPSATPPMPSAPLSGELQVLVDQLPSNARPLFLQKLRLKEGSIDALTNPTDIENVVQEILDSLQLPPEIAAIVGRGVSLIAASIAQSKTKGVSFQETLESLSSEGVSQGGTQGAGVDALLDQPVITPPDEVPVRSFLQGLHDSPALDPKTLQETLTSLLSTGENANVSKEVQLWMFNVAVELFMTLNIIILMQSLIKYAWRQKVIDMQNIMLQMAKDARDLMIKASEMRKDQLLAEASSLFAEGIVNVIHASVAMYMWISSKVEENKIKEENPTKKQLQDQLTQERKIDEQERAELKRLKETEIPTLEKEGGAEEKITIAQKRVAELEAKQANRAKIDAKVKELDEANKKLQEEQQVEELGKVKEKKEKAVADAFTERDAAKKAYDETPAGAEKDAKQPALDQAEAKLQTAQDALTAFNKKSDERTARIDQNDKDKNALLKEDKRVNCEYRLKTHGFFEESVQSQKLESARTELQQRTAIFGNVMSAISSFIKSSATFTRAALEVPAATNEAFSQYLKQILEGFQRLISDIQSNDEAAKTIQNLLDLLKSAQALQSRQ